ncbi:hypothetical protein SCHPADRAFT_487227 [Schizopora paradoxa]|uniref:Uncharacterized protein n=1 Tax=Schizopora paradoxa TaxID=27342 RepID=A0A0H2RH06_9AGAM|nr:hypothetical protein SCHPADRAFT_487227 [Schizopora paradoxa]
MSRKKRKTKHIAKITIHALTLLEQPSEATNEVLSRFTASQERYENLTTKLEAAAAHLRCHEQTFDVFISHKTQEKTNPWRRSCRSQFEYCNAFESVFLLASFQWDVSKVSSAHEFSSQKRPTSSPINLSYSQTKGRCLSNCGSTPRETHKRSIIAFGLPLLPARRPLSRSRHPLRRRRRDELEPPSYKDSVVSLHLRSAHLLAMKISSALAAHCRLGRREQTNIRHLYSRNKR